MYKNLAIFAVCLAAEEADIYHGHWIDATQEVDDIQKAIDAMLMRSPVALTDGFIIRDSVGTFGYVVLQPEDDVLQVHSVARFLHRYGELGAALLEYVKCNVEQAAYMMQEHYCGEFKTVFEYVQQHYGLDIPPTERHARTLWHELVNRGYVCIDIARRVHIFNAC